VTVCASWQSAILGVPSVSLQLNVRRPVLLAGPLYALRRPGHVGELRAVLAVRIELRLIDNNQPLRRADHRCRRERRDRQRAGRRRAVVTV